MPKQGGTERDLPSFLGGLACDEGGKSEIADRHGAACARGAFEIATAQIRLSVVWKNYDSPKAMFRL